MSISDVIASANLPGRVSVIAYTRRTEGMIDLFPTKAQRDKIDMENCLATALTKSQIRVLRVTGDHPWIFEGSVTADPQADNDALFNIRIEGRRWYGTFCRTGRVLIVERMRKLPA
ncbi:MAG: hypothetical protein ACTHJR_00400 [Sphingomonas sp.]|uniref:hypothetical protein n=1 Tax=Sphingomonas sp. TaxID=28214 RepID=UPI003F7D9346